MEGVPIVKFESSHKALLKERKFIKQDRGRAISVPQFPYPKERIEAFEKLITWCINNNVQALKDALQYNESGRIIKELLKYGDEDIHTGYNAYEFVAIVGNDEIMKIIEVYTKEEDIERALDFAIVKDHEKIVQQFNFSRIPAEKLCLALKSQSWNSAELIYAKNVDLCSKIETLNLLLQDNESKLEGVKWIVEKGLDVNEFSLDHREFPIYFAAKSDNLDILKYLVNMGANPDKMTFGCNPMMNAIKIQDQSSSMRTVKNLLVAKSDPNLENAKKQIPLHVAVENGNYDVVKLLIDHGSNMFHQDKKGFNPLQHLEAIYEEVYRPSQFNDICELLSSRMKEELKVISPSYKAIPTYPTIVEESEFEWEKYKKDFQDIVSMCINGKAGDIRTRFYQSQNLINTFLRSDIRDLHTNYRAIDFAAMKGQLEVVKCLLEFGANPDTMQSKKCFSALELAIVHKQERIVKYLIQYGANMQNSLYLALKQDQVDIFKLLLANKNNPDFLSEDGFNVLHLAVRKKKLKLVKLLIEEYGADPNVKSKLKGHGRSALHFAAEVHNCRIIEYLIYQGADVFQKDVNRLTPLDLVKRGVKTNFPEEILENVASYSDSMVEVIDLLASEMKSVNGTENFQDLVEAVEGPSTSRKRKLDDPAYQNGGNKPHLVMPIIQTVLNPSVPFEAKIGCLTAIHAFILEDRNTNKLLIKKDVIEEVAMIASQIILSTGNHQNIDLDVIAKILVKISKSAEGKKLVNEITELRMTQSSLDTLKTSMEKFEAEPTPEQFPFDSESDHWRKKIKTEIKSE